MRPSTFAAAEASAKSPSRAAAPPPAEPDDNNDAEHELWSERYVCYVNSHVLSVRRPELSALHGQRGDLKRTFGAFAPRTAQTVPWQPVVQVRSLSRGVLGGTPWPPEATPAL